ncbi:MAG: hypothetical protein ACLP1Q_07215 [Solirubrobacteraceae bacterium]
MAGASKQGSSESSGPPIVWGSPGEFGQPAASDTRTGIATPLLAGFSIALLAAISQAPDSFRWPGATIFVLLMAIGLFVLSLQLGFRSRGKLYSRAEALSWGRINQHPPEDDERTRAAIQNHHLKGWRRAQRSVGLAYNGGLAALAVGLSLSAAPPQSYPSGPLSAGEQLWRWSAFSLGLLLTVLQVAWILRDEQIHRRLIRGLGRSDDGAEP